MRSEEECRDPEGTVKTRFALLLGVIPWTLAERVLGARQKVEGVSLIEMHSVAVMLESRCLCDSMDVAWTPHGELI